MKVQNSELSVEKIRQMGWFSDKTDAELENILNSLEMLSQVAYSIYVENQKGRSVKLRITGTALDKALKKAA